MTDEEFLKLAQECGASFWGDGFPVNFAHERFLALCREIERRTLERAEKKFEWLEGNLFNKELAALRQQQTFAWNALDSAMIKDHDRTGSLAESITRLAMERDDLRQQQGEPVAVVRDNPDDYGTIIESTGAVNLQPGTKLYREAAPRVPEPNACQCTGQDGHPLNQCDECPR